MTTMPHLTAITWNYADLLRSASNGTFTSYYVYNAGGGRTRKVVVKGNIREERLYLGNYELYRKYVNNTLDTERQTLHIADDQHRFALIDRLTVNNGATLTTPTVAVRYQYDNHLGSASLELDQNAAIISYEEYHPFGTTSYRSGRTETEVALKRYKYVGKERDEETGLYYYGARYYAAWIARFVSVDPLQLKYPHYTPYQYAGNNPLFYIDPDGRDIIPWNKTKVYTFKLPFTNGISSIINTSFKGFTNEQGKAFTLKINEMLKKDGLFKTAYERIEKSKSSFQYKALEFEGGVIGAMKKAEHGLGKYKDAAGWFDYNHWGTTEDPKLIVLDPSKNGHDSKAVIFEETYHGAQSDFYGSNRPSNLTIEVEAKVAKAIDGYAENTPGLEYEYDFQEENKSIIEGYVLEYC
ncbi:MAG TPA: hypothetical protein DF296_13190, partial [Candidatus Margulisbacteria bacterium]|nr:hypothetical protein [Candidatus Margulisiibacteriota bacterium]